ncbi:Sodium channel protein para [Orchesella cincta]|uniref:Sodium channel protein n=1 Tax=Orchesella cincta TaxID=48709 RepID=A0A1D2M7I0_ORCCI|nr:Sodium channel protein para [Orchesella cincta]
MAVATVANLVLLSMAHYELEEDERLYGIMLVGHEMCSIMFAVECLLKIVASGPKSYFKDKWNMFDCSLVFLSGVELTFKYNDNAALNALLCLRSLRVFKLARIWPTLNKIVTGVSSAALGNVSDMTVVAVGVFYTFGVTGVHLFGENYEKVTIHPKSLWHFRDFFHSCLVVFRLLCGEWIESMEQCIDDHGWICIPFFLSAFISLNLIVLNLLLVMFLQHFSTADLSNAKNDGTSDLNNISVAVNRFRRWGKWIEVFFARCLGVKSIENTNIKGNLVSEQEAPKCDEEILPTRRECQTFRSKFRTIMESKFFELFYLGIAISIAISLSLQDVHLYDKPLLTDFLYYLDNITAIFWGVEAAIKIVAMGFSTYIKIKWNRLDFTILLGTIYNAISHFFGMETLPFFNSIKVLRLVPYFEGLKLLLNSLEKAVAKIFGVLLVCLLIWLVYAIIGVQLLKGRLGFCIDPNDWNILNFTIIRNKSECIHFNFIWDTPIDHFDNVGSAYYRVLEIITFKGWIDSLTGAIDSGEIDEQPSFEKNMWIVGYFVAVILGGSFFAFNIFIGVLLDSLNEENKKVKNTNGHLEIQNVYENTRKYMFDKLKAKTSSVNTPKSKYQNAVLRVINSKHFESLRLLNLILTSTLTWVTWFYSQYTVPSLRSPRNIFEIVVEILDVYDFYIAPNSYIQRFYPHLLRLVRVAWVSGYLRHFKAARGLRQLISVIKISLPAFLNICVLLFFVIFIYATLGMELFKNTKLRYGLSDIINFRTFEQAYIILFPVITAAEWNSLIFGLANEDECDDPEPDYGKSGDCGNSILAGVFVLSYLFITFVIFLNLFSAVIMDNYSRVIKLVECELDDRHFAMFYEIWSKFDEDNSHYIDYNLLTNLFDSFEAPFSILKPSRCAISIMNIPVYKGDVVHCADVLDAAITYFYFRKGVVSAENFTNYQNELKDEKGCEQEPITTTLRIQRQRHCVKIIQRGWKTYKNIQPE